MDKNGMLCKVEVRTIWMSMYVTPMLFLLPALLIICVCVWGTQPGACGAHIAQCS